jgi:hypothetical protein
MIMRFVRVALLSLSVLLFLATIALTVTAACNDLAVLCVGRGGSFLELRVGSGKMQMFRAAGYPVRYGPRLFLANDPNEPLLVPTSNRVGRFLFMRTWSGTCTAFVPQEVVSNNRSNTTESPDDIAITMSFQSITVPIYVVATVTLVVPGWFVLAAIRSKLLRGIRAKQGKCIQCGYDMRLITSATCPECGSARLLGRGHAKSGLVRS